jgi:uncharacterized membrane protein YeaQ/YmgE (transglycosylase-associated protein family)
VAIESLIVWLVIGAVAGFLAGLIVKGYGFGTVGNIVVGIIGSILGGAILPRLGLYTGGGLVGEIISATAGAVILLFVIGLVQRSETSSRF